VLVEINGQQVVLDTNNLVSTQGNAIIDADGTKLRDDGVLNSHGNFNYTFSVSTGIYSFKIIHDIYSGSSNGWTYDVRISGDVILHDVDGDDIVNSLDIDSDNDGISDNVEAQYGNTYIAPTGNDSGGLDDAYESTDGLQPVDTNSNGTDDYLEAGITPLIFDLDGDGIETLSVKAGVAFDINADGVVDITGWVAPDDALLV